MKVVILAAGLGSRLDQSYAHLPKPLTQLVNGQSILQYQLTVLKEFVSFDEIFVVVGYQKESIIEAFPEMAYVYNPLFAQENTSKSLLKALKKIDEDVLWLNGDVIFQSSVIERLLSKNQTSLVVNIASVGEEEVKYRADEQGRVLEISKTVKDGQGEALGINFYKKKDLPLLKTHLELCLPQDYFERAIEASIQQGQLVRTTVVGLEQCAEIDFIEDLARANEMLEHWKKSKKT